MNCDSCHQIIDDTQPALRRVITDDNGKIIGQWQWHRDCPPAGPESAFEREDTE